MRRASDPDVAVRVLLDATLARVDPQIGELQALRTELQIRLQNDCPLGRDDAPN